MALREPREILHKGRRLDAILEAHARWVLDEEGGARADLSGAKLTAASLHNTVLHYANLSRAQLHHADLRQANLWEAELSECDLREAVMREAILHGAILQSAQLHRADLRGCDLEGAVLDGSDLVGTDLRGARLLGTHLVKTRLFHVDLRGADLTGSRFEEAELVETHLGACRLNAASFAHAKFLGSDLRGAELDGVDLEGARLEQVRLGHTRIVNCDLGRARGLETCRHVGPTWIDAETLARSGNSLPSVFLYGAGVPASQQAGKEALPVLPGLDLICMIASARRDAEFAERLRMDLMANGVRSWLLPEDANWEGIELGQPPYDALVLVCSRQSLVNAAVMREVERALKREQSERARVLFPLRIDDYLFEGWEHAHKVRLLEKFVGDFRKWKEADLYRAGLDWLLAELRNRGKTGDEDTSSAADQV